MLPLFQCSASLSGSFLDVHFRHTRAYIAEIFLEPGLLCSGQFLPVQGRRADLETAPIPARLAVAKKAPVCEKATRVFLRPSRKIVLKNSHRAPEKATSVEDAWGCSPMRRMDDLVLSAPPGRFPERFFGRMKGEGVE